MKLEEEDVGNDSSGTIDRTMGEVAFQSSTPPSNRILRMGFLMCPRRGNKEFVLILLSMSVNPSPHADKFENLTREKPSA